MPQLTTRTVNRALDILLCFKNEPNLTLTQISERVGMHKSTVYRLLITLESRRFIQRVEETGTYRLGSVLVRLASLVLQSNDIYRQAIPQMHRFSAQYRETIDLAILDQADVVYLHVVQSPLRVKLASAPGERLPAFCTATGKAFLAYLPDKQVQAVLKSGMRKYTECTPTSIPKISKDLREIQERGFAIDVQEFEAGINAVAAPILDSQRYPVAAIAIVGPAFRLPMERLMEIGQALVQTTNAIAQEVGLDVQS